MKETSLSFFEPSINYILEVQIADGSIPWEEKKKLDPWDHIEAAMGLSIAGNKVESEKAFIWLSDNQLDDGSWYSEYIESIQQTKRRDTNFSAYLATGLFHYFLIFEDKKFLERLFPSLEKAMEFVISSQTSKGDIYWAKEEGIEILDDSLITGSSSIYKSLECAIAIYNILGKPIENLKESRLSLKNSINNNPERYDRSWESKSRYSMDWYYPILCGVYDDKEGISIIDSKWSDFIVLGMGCKCVVEEPWVTVAESSELVIALVKLGLIEKAEYIFNSLHQWRDEDGLYWTGYVYTDEKFWPVEKPTWTAGAVLLAADSLYRFTRGSDLFLKDWATNN